MTSYLFSQSDVDLDCLIISIGYLTSVGPCGWWDALSPVQTYELAASVAIEALSSSINGNLDSTGVIELPKSVWQCSTTLLLVSPTVERTSALSNISQREDTVVEVGLSIKLKVYPYTQLAVIRYCNVMYVGVLWCRLLTGWLFWNYCWFLTSWEIELTYMWDTLNFYYALPKEIPSLHSPTWPVWWMTRTCSNT